MENTSKHNKEIDSELHLLEDLSNYIENAPMPMHWVNGSGIIIWANKAELDMLGYTKEEYLNKHINNFHLDKDVIDIIMKRLVAKDTLKNYPARLLCKNGDLKYVLINSNVFWRNGEFIHTRCFTKDITDIVMEKEIMLQRIRELESQLNTNS